MAGWGEMGKGEGEEGQAISLLPRLVLFSKHCL